MMNEEERIAFQAQLHALKYMLAHCFKLACGLAGKSDDDVQQLRAEILEQIRQESFPGYDPAMSDHYAALLEEEIDAFLRAVVTLPPVFPQR